LQGDGDDGGDDYDNDSSGGNSTDPNDDGGDEGDGSDSDGGSGNSTYPTEPPSPYSTGGSTGFDFAFGFGWFVFSVTLLVVVFVLWCLYGHCKRKREQRMLDLRSQQADRVLGDMQMVPNEDLDNELI